MTQRGVFSALYDGLKTGKLTRREFLERATATGMSLAVAGFVANSVGMQGASAQESTGRPTAGTENNTRGQGDELRILLWQAPTTLSPHTATGTKDFLAASLVLEPLFNYLPDATVIPNLVAEMPTVENGGLAEDLTSVTLKLLPGVVWNDGTPFTAADVEFTWKWIIDPANSSVRIGVYSAVASMEVIDDLTVKATFTQPTLAWYVPFAGAFNGVVYPAHVWGGDPANRDAISSFQQAPVGTGPYKVVSFTENDQVIYEINENYREENKPFFKTVNIKGGGDAQSAAQAVLQTGEYHYAWNLQVEPTILRQLEESGGLGKVVVVPGTSVERLDIAFGDPNTEVDGERNKIGVPHPIWSDKLTREALSLACDRETIAGQFYLPPGERATSNIVVGIGAYESPNTSFSFDLEAAAAKLEEAGWMMDGNVRKKDGMELSISYVTSINAVRQKTQAVNKQNWESIGFKVELKEVDAGIYFDSDAGNEQNISHFYNDIQMYTNSPGSPFPIDYMEAWYFGPDGENVAQKANNWSGSNLGRYQSAEYDALYEEVIATTDPARAAELLIAMNDIVIEDVAVVPLVQRAADKYAISNELNNDNVALGPYDSSFWNIQNWIPASM
jgi:peptide/nickel transport system substrate-binding protein